MIKTVMTVLLIIALVLIVLGLSCAFIISGRESRAEERREFEMMKKRNKKD